MPVPDSDAPRAWIHVTLESRGGPYTSSIGPMPESDGWTLWRHFLAYMAHLRASDVRRLEQPPE